MMKTSPLKPDLSLRRNLEWWEISRLERQGCTATDWNLVTISPDTPLGAISFVDFEGSVSLGGGAATRISRARLADCVTGTDVSIRNVPGGISGCLICDNTVIDNTGRIRFEPEASCGVGTEVAVLDESGSRRVLIYPGISAQMAALMARTPQGVDAPAWYMNCASHIDSFPTAPHIGPGAVIRDAGSLLNVIVGAGCIVDGAASLRNGMMISNSSSGQVTAFIGRNVDADGFILEDGRLDSGAIIRHCYIGQGVEIEKGFTAHDSLFFANCSLENGEACAVFAGPYTVSMHKSTLLIGCMTSFMNAGSATNQSNHMYKLGPVHWGILERGVKTSSNSYLMLGAKIGAFSLLMGDHKTHPDSSEFPFSYLFGDEKGATVVVPGMMLRSCGLMRDEKKWPARDRRTRMRIPLHDRITFDVLNPHTVSHILRALETIAKLLARPADDDRFVRYKGMKFSRASLERARMLYTLAIFKYLHTRLGDSPFPDAPEGDSAPASWRWIDLAGQVLPAHLLRDIETLPFPEAEKRLDDIQASFASLERQWIGATFGDYWRERHDRLAAEAARFDEMVDEDRTSYREALNAENAMLRLI